VHAGAGSPARVHGDRSDSRAWPRSQARSRIAANSDAGARGAKMFSSEDAFIEPSARHGGGESVAYLHHSDTRHTCGFARSGAMKEREKENRQIGAARHRRQSRTA